MKRSPSGRDALDIELEYYLQRKKLGIKPPAIGPGALMLPETQEAMKEEAQRLKVREEKRQKNKAEISAKMKELMIAKQSRS